MSKKDIAVMFLMLPFLTVAIPFGFIFKALEIGWVYGAELVKDFCLMMARKVWKGN